MVQKPKIQKNPVGPAVKNAIQIMMSDHYSTIGNYTDETMPKFYARLGELQSMYDGVIPFNGNLDFNVIEPMKETVGEPLHLVFFYCDPSNMRAAKHALRTNLQLIYDPHAMKPNGNETQRYFSIPNLVRQDAMACYEANKHIFTGITFDPNKKQPAMVEPKVRQLPKSLRKKQEEVQALPIQTPTVEEVVETPSVTEEHVVETHTESIPADVDALLSSDGVPDGAEHNVIVETEEQAKNTSSAEPVDPSLLEV